METSPGEPEPIELELAVRGLVISIQSKNLNKQQAIEMLQRWYPDDDIRIYNEVNKQLKDNNGAA
jgi:hypothetical protein